MCIWKVKGIKSVSPHPPHPPQDHTLTLLSESHVGKYPKLGVCNTQVRGQVVNDVLNLMMLWAPFLEKQALGVSTAYAVGFALRDAPETHPLYLGCSVVLIKDSHSNNIISIYEKLQSESSLPWQTEST